MRVLDPITMGRLFDEYGALLTEKQRHCCELYFNEDFSLSEIAEELGISRQAVHDMLNHAGRKLDELEAAFGNVRHEKRLVAAEKELLSCADELRSVDDARLAGLADRIEAAAGMLEKQIAI